MKTKHIIFYLTVTLLVVGLKLMNIERLELMELQLQDALYDFKQISPSSQVVKLVTIDDHSIQEIGSWPWPEEITADLVAAVGTAKPRTTLIDFPLPEFPIDPARKIKKSDRISEQMSWMNNVVITYSILPADTIGDSVTNPKYLFRNAIVTNSDLSVLEPDQALPVKTVVLPDSSIADMAARMGFSYSKEDRDRTLRSEPLVMRYKGFYYPSATLSAVAHYLNVAAENIVAHGGESIEIGDRSIPTGEHGEMLLNFPVSENSFERFSASDILQEKVDLSAFKDKLVIISLATSSQTEYYHTPVSAETPHYFKNAVVIDNILRRNYMDRVDSHLLWYVLALILVGLVGAFALPQISSLYRVLVVATGLVALVNLNFFLFNSLNLMSNSLYVALQLSLFLILHPLASVDYSFLRRKKEGEQEGLEQKEAGDALYRQPAEDVLRNASLTEAAGVMNSTIALPSRKNVVGAGSNMNETLFIPSPSDSQTRLAVAGEVAAEEIASGEVARSGVTPAGSDSEATRAITEEELAQMNSDSGQQSPEKPAQAESSAGLEQTVYGELQAEALDSPLMNEANNEVVEEVVDSLPEKTAEKTALPEKIAPVKSEAPLEESDLAIENPVTAGPDHSTAISPDELSETPAPEISSELGSGYVQLKGNEKLGRYQLQGILGKGAMGLVYKGVDPAINRPLALKTIRLDFLTDPAEMEEMKQRLHLEAQAAGKLSHPNIVVIYDVGSEGTVQYIAMEYLEGQTLEEMIKRKVNFNYKIIAKMIYQICSALQYAHDQGIVHRDIKPANIMVLPDYSIKVMDFGIARIESSSMTKTGVAMGTPNYISPEQLQGKRVDGRSDLFSLGIMFYEMLIGERPFRGDNLTSLIYSIISSEPETPSKLNPRIPPLFDHIILRALKKDPAMRYQKASEIASALQDFVQSFATR